MLTFHIVLGHSLGCAMATLSYSRALLDLDGLHPRVELCDAYLYGAPVVCDMASAKVFNDVMAHRQTATGKVRNVWRVTNVSVLQVPRFVLSGLILFHSAQ